MAARNGAANPGRSLLSVALVACRLLRAGDRGRQPSNVEDGTPEGAGGFPLFAESAVPLAPDLNLRKGASALGLSEEDEAELSGVSILSLCAWCRATT